MKRQRTATTESAASSVAAAASAAVARALGGDGGRGGDASRTVVRSPAVVIPLITLEKSKLKVRYNIYIYIYLRDYALRTSTHIRTPNAEPNVSSGDVFDATQNWCVPCSRFIYEVFLRENTFLLFTFYLILVNEPGG